MTSFNILTPFCQVPQVYFSLKFNENTQIFDALGGVLLDAQEFHQKTFPLAKSIQRCVTQFNTSWIGNKILMKILGRIPAFMLTKAPQNIIVWLTVLLPMV